MIPPLPSAASSRTGHDSVGVQVGLCSEPSWDWEQLSSSFPQTLMVLN